VVDTVRFLNRFTVGYGNYTEDREQLFGNMSPAEMIAEINQSQGEAIEPDHPGS
jgi:hypothetical protein